VGLTKPDGVISVMRIVNQLRPGAARMGRLLCGALLAGAAALMLVPVHAAAPGDSSSDLAVVPAGSAVVIHIKGLVGVKDRLLAYLDKAVPDQAAIAKGFIDQAFEEGIDGRKPFKGLAKMAPSSSSCQNCLSPTRRSHWF